MLFQWKQVKYPFFSPITATNTLKHTSTCNPLHNSQEKGKPWPRPSWSCQGMMQESLSAPTLPALCLPLSYQERCAWNCAGSWIRVIFFVRVSFFFWWWYFFKLTLLLLLFKSQENTWDNTESTSHKPTRKLQLLDWICVNNKDVHTTGIQAARNFWVYLFLILTPLLLPILSIFPLYF